MKDSKEKEHRISNLKDMINNVTDDEIKSYEEMEEDSELIDYLNEDTVDYDNIAIDDEFIYRPGDEKNYAVNLEENIIDEDFIIKTPKIEDLDKDENEDLNDTFGNEISDNFDSVINAKIGGRPFIGVVSTVLGAILVILSIFILDSRADRVIDNVVAGETKFMFVIFFIIGLLLLIYGVFKVFGIKNPFGKITESIDSIDNETEQDENTAEKEKPSQKNISESELPLDKDSYKIGEFDMEDLKDSLKKPTSSDENDIPPAIEKPSKKKGLDDDAGYIEPDPRLLENETIDDIFADVEDIDEIPIISVDSKEEK
jgi:hypothetical protein